MRQFVSWRFWLTILVLVAATLVLVFAVGTSGNDEIDEVTQPVTRRLDLIGVPDEFDANEEWGVRRGVSEGEASFTLDGRTYRIAAGTLGELDCDVPTQRCMLLADRLGDAIVWFTFVEVDTDTGEVRLPPIEAPLDGVTWARLVNGWELPLLTVVERRCDTETTSFLDFLDRFGVEHETFLDEASREISAVRCNAV